MLKGIESVGGSSVDFRSESCVLFGKFVGRFVGVEGEVLSLVLEDDRDLLFGRNVDDFGALREHGKYL